MASSTSQELKVAELLKRLQNEQQVVKDFWVHIDSSSPLEKYPAKQHAKLVAQKLGVTKGLVYLPGAPTEYEEDSDQPKPFRQRRYFYYLSGVNETDCHLTYDIYEDALTLFIPRIDPATVIWNGRGSTRAEAFDKYDVDEVHYNTSVADFVSKWPTTHGGDVYILHPNQAAIVGQYKHSRVDFQKLQIAINSARMIKDDHEIGLIRKANDITAKAHREVLLNILKFKNESQVEAIFLDACVSEGAKHQAYEVIAASGVNASTLHYIKNDEPLEGRQLMCLDAGCEWECYASDVTRSFPLSGSWPSREAKQIHDLVKTMQDCCIKRLAPGIRYLDLHILAHHIAIDGLLALGILHNGSVEEIYLAGTSRAFFPHGLGHHIGLEVHDIGQRELMSLDGDGISSVDAQTKSKYSANYHLPVYHPGLCMSPTDTQSPVLEAGMVVTVEPGIYFSLYALETLYLPSPVHSKYINRDVLARFIPVGGVRIEDDILITRFGYENLTTAPKGEEMLEIIKSQAKPDLSLPISTAATAASPYIPPPAPLPGGLPCLTSSALSVKPAPRRKLFSCNACRYCHSRMGKCNAPGEPNDRGRCRACVRFDQKECVMVPRKVDKPVQIPGEMEFAQGPILFKDFMSPATAPFRPRSTNALERPEPSLPTYKQEMTSTQRSTKDLHITRLLGSKQPTWNREESIVMAHPSNQPWDGMDALGSAVDRVSDTEQQPPQVPKKPLAYRHNVPCFTQTPDHRLCAPPQQSSSTARPLGDSSSPPQTLASPPRQSPPQNPSAISSPTTKTRLSRPSNPPETWSALRSRMNTDPPAVPSWLCAELDALRVTYPTSNINPVMMFSAVDAKTSVVLQLRSDLPAPTHPGVLYTYLPRIRCMDCPGKLYTPPMANFEIHLKNRWHKAAVAGGRGEEVV